MYQKACSAAGSEASFFGMKLSSTKGRTPVGQEAVVDLIDVGEVVDGVSMLVVEIEEADFIVEDAVETDCLKSCYIFYRAQIVAVAFHGSDRMARPEPKICSQ